MIHIVTTHYKNDVWFDIQKEYLEKYTSEDYKVVCGNYCMHISCDSPRYIFYDISALEDSHYVQANCLANRALLPTLSDDDIFIFMDCDTLPCEYGWDLKVKEHLSEKNDIVAIVMRENKVSSTEYANLPHLSFFATTKKVWVENNLCWYLDGSENPQVGMKNLISKKGLKLKELNRTNVFNAHNVMFGVYDNLIYHHSCALRAFPSRTYPDGSASEASDFNLRKCRFSPDIEKLNVDIWHSVFNAIKKDKSRDFIRRYFMGEHG